MAQTTLPPNNGDTGNGGGIPVVGGAPIGDAIIMLVTASVAYHKYKFPWQKETDQIND